MVPEVVALPTPSPLFFDGDRLPASHANFYIANAAALTVTFNDQPAKQEWRLDFPGANSEFSQEANDRPWACPLIAGLLAELW